MKPRFADTAWFLALLNPRDALHASAVGLHEAGTEALVTSEWVLLEVADAFSAPANRRLFRDLMDSLAASTDASVVPADSELFQRGCKLHFDRPDKGWSLTDCLSFVIMSDHGLTEALTADHHFEQAGFTALMRA